MRINAESAVGVGPAAQNAAAGMITWPEIATILGESEASGVVLS